MRYEAAWAIRTYMEGRHDHPTADSVYAAVREELPKVSLLEPFIMTLCNLLTQVSSRLLIPAIISLV